jgi:dipeptidyl aminopeptidase/acylaminoacyl peptidase
MACAAKQSVHPSNKYPRLSQGVWRLLIVYLIACSYLAPVGAHAGDAAVPLEVYGRLPSLEDVALSPSGERIAFVHTLENARVVSIASLVGRKIVGRIRVGDEKLRSLMWADEEHLVCLISATTVPFGLIGKRYEWFELQVYDVAANKIYPIPLRDFILTSPRLMNMVAGPATIRRLDGRPVLFVPGIYIERGAALRVLIRVDLDSGRQSLVRSDSLPTTWTWLIDAQGEIAAEQDYDQRSEHWKLRIRRDGNLREVASGQAALDVPFLRGFGPTPETVLVQALEDEEQVWRLLSLKDGSLGPPLAERRTLADPIEERLTSRMVGGSYIDDDTHYVFFDPALQARWDAIVRAFAGEHVRLVSSAEGFTKLVVRVDGARDGYVYELVDLEAHRSDVLGSVYDGVEVPFEVHRITYPAGDGTQIPAYLTLPRGRAEKSLPLIVLPHGGPAVRDTLDFDWWSQALADQGYAVLRPNYRGSNLDRRWLAAGFGQWGRKNANRPLRRRPLSRQRRQSRPGARLHRRCKLRRLSGARWRDP